MSSRRQESGESVSGPPGEQEMVKKRLFYGAVKIYATKKTTKNNNKNLVIAIFWL